MSVAGVNERGTGRRQELDKLLRTLQESLYLRVERRGGSIDLRSGVREHAIGALNLETGALTAKAPSEMLGPLLEEHQELRPTRDGVSVRVTDAAARRAAEALILRCIEFERYAPQLHHASP